MGNNPRIALGCVDTKDSLSFDFVIHMWTPPWQGHCCRDGFDRLLSYVRPVCAAFLLPLALMETHR